MAWSYSSTYSGGSGYGGGYSSGGGSSGSGSSGSSSGGGVTRKVQEEAPQIQEAARQLGVRPNQIQSVTHKGFDGNQSFSQQYASASTWQEKQAVINRFDMAARQQGYVSSGPVSARGLTTGESDVVQPAAQAVTYEKVARVGATRPTRAEGVMEERALGLASGGYYVEPEEVVITRAPGGARETLASNMQGFISVARGKGRFAPSVKGETIQPGASGFTPVGSPMTREEVYTGEDFVRTQRGAQDFTPPTTRVTMRDFAVSPITLSQTSSELQKRRAPTTDIFSGQFLQEQFRAAAGRPVGERVEGLRLKPSARKAAGPLAVDLESSAEIAVGFAETVTAVPDFILGIPKDPLRVVPVLAAGVAVAATGGAAAVPLAVGFGGVYAGSSVLRRAGKGQTPRQILAGSAGEVTGLGASTILISKGASVAARSVKSALRGPTRVGTLGRADVVYAEELQSGYSKVGGAFKVRGITQRGELVTLKGKFKQLTSPEAPAYTVSYGKATVQVPRFGGGFAKVKSPILQKGVSQTINYEVVSAADPVSVPVTVSKGLTMAGKPLGFEGVSAPVSTPVFRSAPDYTITLGKAQVLPAGTEQLFTGRTRVYSSTRQAFDVSGLTRVFVRPGVRLPSSAPASPVGGPVIGVKGASVQLTKGLGVTQAQVLRAPSVSLPSFTGLVEQAASKASAQVFGQQAQAMVFAAAPAASVVTPRFKPSSQVQAPRVGRATGLVTQVQLSEPRVEVALGVPVVAPRVTTQVLKPREVVLPRTSFEVSTRVVQPVAVSSVSAQVLRAPTLPRTSQLPRVMEVPAVARVALPQALTAPRSPLVLEPRVGLVQKQLTRPAPLVAPPGLPLGVSSPITPPVAAPFVLPTTGFFGLPFKKPLKRGKRRFGYQPDITSVIFKRKSRRAPEGLFGGGLFSGLELRPII